MDPISAPLTALNLVIAICEIRKQIKANYADCSRLLARCEIFHPTLQQIQANPSIYRPTSEPAYQALVRNLEATVKFARMFQESTVYRTLVRAVSRNAYAQEIASLNLLLTESATDLGVTQSIDFEVRRREDMEDAKACFQYCVDCLLEELSALGEQSADQFAQLQGDIEDNKAYLKTLLDLLEHRKLKPAEQLQVDEAMDGMKAQVLRCHAEVMAALQRISNKLDTQHEQISDKMDGLSGNVMALLNLLSERKQSVDKEQQRTQHLNRHLLSLDSVLWSEHEILGKGAFGTVCKGSYHGNSVAIKVIPIVKGPARDVEKHIRSLENEVILLREVEYPAILHCYGFARDAGNFIIIAEIAPFGSLDCLIKEDDVLFPAVLLIAWFLDIISAIAFVHSKGIKHRDIKAENFLVFPQFMLKLCDFGLAKEQSSSLRTSTINGTVGFVAPEVWQIGSQYSSDIYSYAMTTVQIITGDHPKQGNAVQQVQAAVAGLDLTADKEPLLAVLIRCCFYDPSNRSDPVSLRPKASEVKEEMASILSLAGGDVRHGLEIYQMASKVMELKLKRQRNEGAASLPSSFGSAGFSSSQSVLNERKTIVADDRPAIVAHKEEEQHVAEQKALEDVRKEKELQAQKEAERQALRAAEQKALDDAREEKELLSQKEVEEQALRVIKQKEQQARKQAEQKAFRTEQIAQEDARKEMQLLARKDMGQQALRAAEHKVLEDVREGTALLVYLGAEQQAFHADLIAQDDARKELQLLVRKDLGQQALRAAEREALENVRKETELEAQKEAGQTAHVDAVQDAVAGQIARD